jgi:hypothetical protein
VTAVEGKTRVVSAELRTGVSQVGQALTNMTRVTQQNAAVVG